MNKDRRITREELKNAINEAFFSIKEKKGGKNANYIPYLANVDSNLFGISVCLPDGEILSVGDGDYCFGMESISKVATAILVLKDYGAETLLKMIGADATGMPFNSILAILLENNHPSTPLVNAGAISAVSMVRPVGNSRGKWEAIKKNIAELCGSDTPLIEELYKSKYQQPSEPFNSMVTEELQPHIRRARHCARLIHATMLARRNNKTAIHHGGNDCLRRI